MREVAVIRTTETLLFRDSEFKISPGPLSSCDALARNPNLPPCALIEYPDHFRICGGYLALWEVMNERLYLTRIIGEWELLHGQTEVSAEHLFPGAGGKILADWFTGTLLCRRSSGLLDLHSKSTNVGELGLAIKFAQGVLKSEHLKLLPPETKETASAYLPAFLQSDKPIPPNEASTKTCQVCGSPLATTCSNENCEECRTSGRNDPLFEKAVELIQNHKKASPSLLVHILGVGYRRALRMLAAMKT